MKKIVHILTWLAALACAAGTALGLVVGPWWWMADLASHFQAQYAMGLTAAGAVAAAARWWRLAIVCGVPLAVNVVLIAPLYVGSGAARVVPGVPGAPGAPEAPTLTLVQFNVHTANRNRREVAAYLDESEADVIFTQEVNRAWIEALSEGMSRYRVAYALPREDNFGLAMFVRDGMEAELLSASAAELANDSAEMLKPAIDARLRLNGRELAILSVHALPPLSSGYARRRDAQLAAAGRWVVAQNCPVIVVGDFNATPWCASFRQLVGKSGLCNSQRGFGIQASWPARLPQPLMIPIDHCLHSAALVTVDRRLGPALGSDHRALRVELVWSAELDRTASDVE